jgi:hypothetical protein
VPQESTQDTPAARRIDQSEAGARLMRVYHFLRAEHALDDIKHRRIKISEIDKLNDPFELWCSAQDNPKVRHALRDWKHQMARLYGMLCFCPSCSNPVLWSHYADKHRGMCLGFDISQNGLLKKVRYVTKRTQLPVRPAEADMHELLFTKYHDWSYEEELRGWFRLEERDATGHYFYKFDQTIKLREVIAGPLCEVSHDEIGKALSSYGQEASQARLAFKTFRIVERGFSRLR